MTEPSYRSLRVPMWCPICGQMMAGSHHNGKYYDFGCCADCHIDLVEGREQRWADGWRPTADEVTRLITQRRGG